MLFIVIIDLEIFKSQMKRSETQTLKHEQLIQGVILPTLYLKHFENHSL